MATLINQIETPYGNILLNATDEGWIYVEDEKCCFKKSYFGYSFKEDPSYNWLMQVAGIWNYVVENKAYDLNVLIAVIEDCACIDSACFYTFSPKAKRILYDHVQQICGQKDSPLVYTEEQKKELEYWGKDCILVSKSIYDLLEDFIEPIESIKEHLCKYNEINSYDDSMLNEIVFMLRDIYWCATRDRIKICSFENEKLFGLYGKKDGTIYLSEKILNDYRELLITLVHEFSHDFGDDGTKNHLEAVQTILAECVLAERKMDA